MDNTTQPDDATAKFEARPGAADPYATRLVCELPHTRGILACRYEPTGRYLFAGARDNFVHRWDLSMKAAVPDSPEPRSKEKPVIPVGPAESRLELPGHESWVRAMAVFPDGQQLATGDYVGRVILWKDILDQPKPRFTWEAHQGSVRAVAVSPDGESVASAGNDGLVSVWSSGGHDQPVLQLRHDCHVYHVAYHPDGKSLVSADLKGRVKHWDAQTGKQLRELDASLLYTYSEKYEVDVGGIRGMSFNADGSRLACAGATGEKGIAHSGNARVLLFDWETGELLKALKPEKEEICTAWGVQFHPEGFVVASGGSRTGGFLWFWTPDEETAFHTLKFRQRAPGFDVALAPDKMTLAVADHDGAIRLYEMQADQTPQPQ